MKLFDMGMTVLITALMAGLGWHFGWFDPGIKP